MSRRTFTTDQLLEVADRHRTEDNPLTAEILEWAAQRITTLEQERDDAQQVANAKLIAAAPDLLACLRRMCGMYGAYSKRLAPLLAEDDGTVWTFERANGLACEAIAKAEGK